MIYFDNAATSLPKPPEVEQAVVQALRTFGNAGRGAHAPTMDAARMIYDTREKLAALFHIPDASRISFMSNATEALNTAIFGLLEPGDHVITTDCEHNSVLRPLYQMEKSGVSVSFLPVDAKGQLLYDQMEQALCENTKAVIVTHASNVTGNVTDLSRVADFVHAHGLFLIVDAAQTAGILPIDVQRDGIDILCFTGHKGLLGPQGTGGIYVREGIVLRPLKVGGSGILSYEHAHPSAMPEALEAGTLNGHGIAGLHAALTYLERMGIENIYKREMELSRRFVEGVSNIKGVHLYGDFTTEERVATVSLNIRDYDSAEVSDWLWENEQIAVRSGAHCAPRIHEALGTTAQGAVRFGFSHYNTEQEIDTAIQAIRTLAEE